MRFPRVRFTLRQHLLAVLVAAAGLGLYSLWNREYTETALLFTLPVTRATYTRTYGNWLMERLGLGERRYTNWTAIPEPPAPAVGFRMPELGELMGRPAGSDRLTVP
jgi:hypothetical protein